MVGLPNTLGSYVLAVLVLMLAAACSSSGGPPPESMDDAPAFVEEYRIGMGDQLRIDVWRHPDLTVNVPVRPDGKVTVPIAGDVDVGGRTPDAVGEVISQALSTYIRDPIVTVSVLGIGSNEYLMRVRVTGAVGSPASIAYRPGMTVLDVVLEAGGPTEFAAPSKTVLYREGERIAVRLDRILNKGDMRTNFPMRPGDVVTVPERVF